MEVHARARCLVAQHLLECLKHPNNPMLISVRVFLDLIVNADQIFRNAAVNAVVVNFTPNIDPEVEAEAIFTEVFDLQ